MNNKQKVYSQEQLNPEDVGQKKHERDRASEAKASMGKAVPPSDDADNGAPANGKALDADGNAGSKKSCAIGGEGVAEPGSSRLSSYPELCDGDDGEDMAFKTTHNKDESLPQFMKSPQLIFSHKNS